MGKGGDATVVSSEADSSVMKDDKLTKEIVRGEAGLDDFHWIPGKQPHIPRAREIKEAHPEVTKLMGYDQSTKYKIVLAILVQWVSIHLLQGAPFWCVAICCYLLSGTVTGSMTLAMHELSHNLGAKKPVTNKWMAILANLTMGIPAASTFRRYHLEHHKFMGEDEIDVDIPTIAEGSFFQSVFAKLVWLFFQPAWYSLRPLVVNHKDPATWEFINYACSIGADLIVYYFYGIQGVLYLCLGTLFGMQYNPVAGHFVAEHFVMQEGQETYSYYGPLNWLTFYVGYHNEHHDFPFITGNKLADLRAMAPEYFDDIPHYHSWTKVLYDFIVDPSLTPFSRVKRNEMSDDELAALRAKGGLISK